LSCGEAERLVKKLASKIEYHTGQRYSDVIEYIRKRVNPKVEPGAGYIIIRVRMTLCTFVHNLEFEIEISPILCDWEGVKNASSSTFH